MAAVLSATAFLEASINDLYREMKQARGNGSRPLNRRAVSLIPKFWPDIERTPILHRYQVALLLADAERFNENRSPFREADGLLRLRDALVHHKTEFDDRRARVQRLEHWLRTAFEPNALAPGGDVWFPDLCLGAGCAEWAVRTAEAFSDEFCTRMSIPARGMAPREGAA